MNTEKNKGLLISLLRLFMIFVFVLAFLWIWFQYLNVLKINPFENKGNWLIAGVYSIELALLMKVYGGLKIGHLERWNIILSQCLSLVICNAIMTVQIILIVGDMHLIEEIIKAIVLLTGIDFLLSFVLVNMVDPVVYKIYPAKRILLIYEAYSPEKMIAKFERRKDKYLICETISISDGNQIVKD